MTKDELKSKLDASQERVDKRLGTLTKLCKKTGVNLDDLLEKSKSFTHPFTYAHAKEEFNLPEENEDKYRDKEGNWTDKCDEVREKNDKIYQIYDNIFKLKELEEVRDNWKAKYTTQVNKESATKIQVLVDFLNEWEENAYSWYVENCNYATELMNKFHKVAYDFLNTAYDWSNLSYVEKRELKRDALPLFNQHMLTTLHVQPRYRNSDASEVDMLRAYNISAFTQELMKTKFKSKDDDSYGQFFGHQEYEGEYVLESIDEETLKKTLEKEAQAKYEDLCNRISAVVGEIEDVSNLHISTNGQLNGVVKGSLRSAKVETIGAGGYNIQCFHYRTLVHKL